LFPELNQPKDLKCLNVFTIKVTLPVKVNSALFARMVRVLVKADVRPGVLANARFTLLRGFVGKTALMERAVSLKNLVIKDVKRVVNAHVVVDVVN
jgi:hypothetical protein